jgi:hypothetical protein
LKITEFFVRRPCISIITPYILLVILGGIAVMTDMMGFATMDDSWLLNDHEKVINRDIMKVSNWELNREKSGLDDAKKLEEGNWVRFKSNPEMNSILMMYEDKTGGPAGLLTKAAFKNIIQFE